MKVVPFASVARADWDRVADRSGEAWLFHRSGWVEVEARFAARANCSFALADDSGDIVGIHPLYLRVLDRGWAERVLDSGYHRHTGLALLDGLPPSHRSAAEKLAMRHVFAEAQRLDADRILLNAQNLAPAVLANRARDVPFWVRDHEFELGLHVGPCGDVAVPGAATLCADQIVRLDAPEDERFRNLESACQRAIRKAERHGLTFAPELPDPVERYYRLAQVSAERTGEPLLPRDYYQTIWDSFGRAGRAAVLFALHDGQPAAAVFLLLDKNAASYLGGVCHHDFLAMRVNDFLQWRAMCWCGERGIRLYRLGPIFPELPPEWPVSRVSRFKGKFGGESYTTIQGSYFCKPQRYLEDALRVARESCQARTQMVEQRLRAERARNAGPAVNLAMVLRRYGFAGVAPRPDAKELADRLGVWRLECGLSPADLGDRLNVVIHPNGELPPGLDVRCRAEPAPALLHEVSRRARAGARRPAYHALLPHTSFDGPGVEPIWVNEQGRAVLAWLAWRGRKVLLVGLDVAEEVLRYTQGDPEQVHRFLDKTRFNFTFERANYLFDTNLVAGHATVPWADRLGFTFARLLARRTGLPLLEPLPGGAAGAVMLTGDDDQAALSCYAQQMKAIGDFPITYFLLPMTKHSRETLAALPPTVEFGLHVDALDQPDRYEEICADQCAAVRGLTGAAVRAVRNHGFLSRGYLGHLRAWEENGLVLDVNYAGLDGTALNGSFLPGHVRRPDGSWSGHLSLLTAFGDGMLYIRQWTEEQAIRQIQLVAAQVEQSDPGVLVFNMHPENIGDTRRLHQAILQLGRRARWTALGAESYLKWLEAWNRISVRCEDGRTVVETPSPMSGLVVKVADGGGWRSVALPPDVRTHELAAGSRAA